MSNLLLLPLKIKRDISGFEGLYYVTPYGEVFSYGREYVTGEYNITIKMEEHRMAAPKNQGGYLHLNLSKKGKRYDKKVHALVAMAYIPNPFKKRTVNHKDGNKLNNYVGNLEWNTHSENLTHAYKNNLRKACCGINHPKAKLNNDQVLEIKSSKLSWLKLSKIYNISKPVIGRIKQGKGYSNV